MNILFTVTESYIPYCGIAIHSLIDSNQDLDLINIYVLGTDITETSKKALSETVKEASNLHGKVKIYFPTLSNQDLEEIEGMAKYLPYNLNISFLLRLYVDRIIPAILS